MSEHRIRLRGAWDWHVAPGEGEAEVARRVTLPTAWPPGEASPFLLLRGFGRPPLDPDRESVRLELLDVPGLVSVRINGREVARPPRGSVAWTVAIDGPLLPRNALVLEVDLGGVASSDLASAWGSVALVISPRGPDDPRVAGGPATDE